MLIFSHHLIKKKQKFCAPSAHTSKCMFFWELDTPLYTLMMIVYIQWYRIFLGAPSLPPEILLQIRLDPPLWRSTLITQASYKWGFDDVIGWWSYNKGTHILLFKVWQELKIIYGHYVHESGSFFELCLRVGYKPSILSHFGYIAKWRNTPSDDVQHPKI